MMVSIILFDTGYVSEDLTGTKFPLFSSATTAQKQMGEFRTGDGTNGLILKIDAINFGDSNTLQTISNFTNIQSSTKRISKQPIKFSLTGFLTKPRDNFAKVNNILPSKKDLPDLTYLLMYTLTKGHKDLLIYDATDADREQLFSLYYLISNFGKTDIGNPYLRKHLNVTVDSYSVNESPTTLSYTLQLTVTRLDFE